MRKVEEGQAQGWRVAALAVPVLVAGLAMSACGKRAPAAATAASAVDAGTASAPVNVVQPGAPGEATKVLASTATPAFPTPQPAMADVMFMQGMIEHHNQALQMVGLIPTHTHNPQVAAIGDKIRISQSEEIQTMEDWLRDHHDSVPVIGVNGVVTLDGKAMAPMQGMLTPPQMKQLEAARGAAFDRLFLTYMIQHHTGALDMVHQLQNTPGADELPGIFNYATDVFRGQQAEIRRMQGLLGETK